MRRILSLLLALSFVFAFPMMTNADGEAYDISYSADDGVLIINNLQADTAGRIVLGFKKSDVTVYANTGTVKKPVMEAATADNEADIWWDACYSSAATYYAEDENYTYIGVDWYNTAAVNTSESEDDYLFWITVEFTDEAALNSESIITVLDQTALEALLPSTAGYYGSTLAGISDGVAMPVAITYPNSTVDPDPGNVDTYAAADGTATAKVYYESAVSGTAIIAVYNEAGTMIGHTIADEAVTDATVLDLSATYDADETVKTIKVFVWNNVGTDNTATVAAKVSGNLAE